MANRITTVYLEQSRLSRPPGYSEVLNGMEIPKFADPCKVHTHTEKVRHEFDKLESAIEDEEDLVRFCKEVFSYSAFCFMLSNSDTHVLDYGLLDDIESSLKDYKDQITLKSSDFVFFKVPICLSLDALRLAIRELEVEYWRWAYSEPLIAHLYTHVVLEPTTVSKKMQNVILMGSILNRMSSLIYWYTRLVFQRETGGQKIPQWKD
jgi:hypothetical protein